MFVEPVTLPDTRKLLTFLEIFLNESDCGPRPIWTVDNNVDLVNSLILFYVFYSFSVPVDKVLEDLGQGKSKVYLYSTGSVKFPVVD